MMIITRAASCRSRKIHPRPPEIGCGPFWHDQGPGVAKRILPTTMIGIISDYAAHMQIFPCYLTRFMTQKSLDARLRKVQKGKFNHEPDRVDCGCGGARRPDQG
jgi:hypothetical protein